MQFSCSASILPGSEKCRDGATRTACHHIMQPSASPAVFSWVEPVAGPEYSYRLMFARHRRGETGVRLRSTAVAQQDNPGLGDSSSEVNQRCRLRLASATRHASRNASAFSLMEVLRSEPTLMLSLDSEEVADQAESVLRLLAAPVRQQQNRSALARSNRRRSLCVPRGHSKAPDGCIPYNE